MHDTGEDDGRNLDERLVPTSVIENRQITRMDTYLSDLDMMDAYLDNASAIGRGEHLAEGVAAFPGEVANLTVQLRPVAPLNECVSCRRRNVVIEL